MIILKRLIPRSVKERIKNKLQARAFARAMRIFTSLRIGEAPSREMLMDLQVGWGNESFAARTDYLQEVARQALVTSGPVLECGSGLTTIILGILAGRRGCETWSLEHNPDWEKKVVGTIDHYRIPAVHVNLCPLRTHSDFAWYDTSLITPPEAFPLVICDGPPGTTLGNRYGLLPIMKSRLHSGTIIVLDDTDRPQESEVIRRWSAERDVIVEDRNSQTGSYAILTLR